MVSVVSQMVVVLVNRVLSDGSVNWLLARRPNYPQYLVMNFYRIYFNLILIFRQSEIILKCLRQLLFECCVHKFYNPVKICSIHRSKYGGKRIFHSVKKIVMIFLLL